MDPAPARRVVVRAADQPGDLGWIVQAHGEAYAAQYGWDTSFEALVARIVADYAATRDPAREGGWIAEVGGQRAGCVLCVSGGPGTARLRVLLTLPAARGLGAGSALVRECMDFARAAGYRRMTLWTHDVLESARKIYLASGFCLVSAEEHASFGADLVSQVYEADLAAVPS